MLQQRAFDLLIDQRRTLLKAIHTADHHLGQLDKLREQMFAARDRMIHDLKDLEAELDRLEAWEGDPAVLVRRSVGGYGPTPYHDAANPCGHVWKREQFDEIVLGEAEAEGYTPCGFCGAHALGRRRYSAAA